MDALNHLLALGGVRAEVTGRCPVATGTGLDAGAMEKHATGFLVVLAGRTRVLLSGGATTLLSEGDVLLGVHPTIHPAGPGTEGGTGRSLDAYGQADGCDVLWGRLVFATDVGALLFAGFRGPVQLPSGARLTAVLALLRRELDGRAMGAHAVITAMVQVLLVSVLRAVTKDTGVQPSLLAAVAEPRLARAVSALLEHPGRAWTVRELATHALMSKATFTRHFGATAGVSPMVAFTRLRLHLAAAELRASSLSVARIGERVGYRSEVAFNRAFAGMFQLTPARFRRTMSRAPAG